MAGRRHARPPAPAPWRCAVSPAGERQLGALAGRRSHLHRDEVRLPLKAVSGTVVRAVRSAVSRHPGPGSHEVADFGGVQRWGLRSIPNPRIRPRRGRWRRRPSGRQLLRGYAGHDELETARPVATRSATRRPVPDGAGRRATAASPLRALHQSVALRRRPPARSPVAAVWSRTRDVRIEEHVSQSGHRRAEVVRAPRSFPRCRAILRDRPA
jgi:hypothetical protein